MHTLIVIGWTGSKSCYLDIAREEAIRRWQTSQAGDLDRVAEDLAQPGFICEFEFEDEFEAYDVWGKE